jgi:tetratricopeptide (TPR) repeat protein
MHDASERHPIDLLAAEFSERYRRGERPSIREYQLRHPDLAAAIRALFPAVLHLEEMKSLRPTAADDLPARPGVPEWLGDCRLKREVGRGGMGVVYEAEQPSLGRRVAVKVLTVHPWLAPKQVRRFYREARTMARLHHTNIVPVFEVGEHGGFPCYVMQFIDGVGLDEIVEGWRWMAAAGTPPAGRWRDTARAGLQAAEALAYAHAQGTVHRDIKPSNLLLDVRGTVWVTDFGLARTAGQDDLTDPGETPGTLRYMAPERFRGECDGRGDVYSLGLTLYEMLALRSAFGESDHERLVRQVTQEEPAAPRHFDPAVPRDLETVVLKAMARDPARRYQSAGELADDLRRFLDGKPVRARRVSPAGRFWRWCRRNPAVASLSALALGLLVAVAVIAQVAYEQARVALAREESQRVQIEEQGRIAEAGLERARAAAAREAAQRREADGQRSRAEENLRLGLRAFEEIFDLASRRDGCPEPGGDEDGGESARPPVVSPDVAALLQHLLKFYDEFGERNQGDRRLQREIARANRRVGDIQQRLGQFDQAETAYRRALALDEERLRSSPDEADGARETAAVLNDLGQLLERTGRTAEAGKAHQQALQRLEANALTTQSRFERARTHSTLGKLLWKSGLRDRAEQHCRSALALLAELLRADPANPEYRAAQARNYRFLYSLLAFTGRHEESAAAYHESVALLERLAEDTPAVPDYRSELCKVLLLSAPGEQVTPRGPDAERRLRRAADLAADLAGAYPTVPAYRSLQGRAFQRLGSFLDGVGRADEAERYHREAVALQRALVERFPSVPTHLYYRAEACHSLGTALLRRGNLAESCSLLQEAIDARRQYLKATPDNRHGRLALSRQYLELAGVFRRQGKQAQAEEAVRDAQAALRGK